MDMMPPMNDPNMMGGADPNGGMPPMEDPNMMNGDTNGMDMGGNSEFDTNFDAGVEADENTDPKKFIQQLTGKLSQSLRKYNSELPQPDSELSKYVAGMILKQSTEGLTDADKKDIIDKVNNNDNPNNDEQPSDDGAQQVDGQGQNMEQSMMENINHKRLVNEIFQELTQNRDNKNKISSRPLKNVGYSKKPFTSPSLD